MNTIEIKKSVKKLICGYLVPDSGNIKLFGRNYTCSTLICAGLGALSNLILKTSLV